MPELDFGDRLRGRGEAEKRGREDDAPETGDAMRHGDPPDELGSVPALDGNSMSFPAFF
jgi:hypothetical protein